MSQEDMQIDTTTHEDHTEETKEEEEENIKNIAVDLLIMVKSAQNQNGLRHNDYARYHKYCQRKLHRMRKSLKFMHGRKKFEKKVVTPADAQKNSKFIHLMVFKCEANWSYAMRQKQIISQAGSNVKGENRNPNRVKYLAKKRLQKCYQAAEILFNVAKESLDAFQQVEVEAYTAHLKAVYLMEIKDFQNALDNLIKSKIIYEKIAQYKDTLEEVIYREKVGQLDTLIRQCSFSLKGLMSNDEQDKMINGLVKDYPKKAEIEKQVQKVKVETKKEQIENIEEISYNNKIIPLKTDKLKQVFKRVESHMHDIQEYWSSSSFESGQQIKNYLQLVNILEDAALVIKKEKTEESKKSEQSGQLYNILLSYVQKLKLQSSIERNLLQAKTLSKKIDIETLFSNTKLKSELRPQNVVRFYEKVLKAQRSIINMEKDLIDPFKQLEYEFYEKLYNTTIKYYIGLHYANDKKYTEAYLILNKVTTDIEGTIEFAQKGNLQSQKVKRDLQEMEDGTLKNLNYLICKCHSRILQEQHDEFAKLQDDFSKVEVGGEENKGLKQVKFDNLYDILFNEAGQPKQNTTKKVLFSGDKLDFVDSQGQNILFVDTVGQRKAIELDKLKISKTFKLVNPVPKFQSVPATPQFFDLAGAYLSYPNLEESLGKYKPQGGGLLGAISGFFGRRQ